MPQLKLDIKTPDTLKKMADKTAKSLEKVAAYENKINYGLMKTAKTAKAVGDTGRKREADIKKEIGFVDKLSKHYLMVRDAVMVAFRAAKAMTLDAMEAGNELTKVTKAMQFEVNMFTAGTKEGAQFAEIEKFANSLGKGKKYVQEFTEVWLKARKASTPLQVVSNKQASQLALVWADIRAISQSSEVASKVTDEWISKFAEGPGVADRFLQQVKAAHKGWEKIGTGDLARTQKGPLDLEDKMDAASNKMVQALAPLTKLLNDLRSSFADFLGKLASNKMFKNFIAEVAKDIRWFIEKGLPAFGKAITEFFDTFSKAIEAFSAKSGSVLDKMTAAFTVFKKTFFNDVQPTEILPPKNTAPKFEMQRLVPEKKGAMNEGPSRGERQLAGINIQNLNVNGTNQSAEQIARSVRQEMQLLLQAGALSKGLA